MTSGPAPRRLYLFQNISATVMIDDQPVAMSMGCYLIQMSDGQNVLVDSGPPPDMQTPPGARIMPHVIEQLAALGLHPEDIDYLICTHYDMDHVGYHERFTNAELVVQREHDAAARGGHERFAGSRPHWDYPGARYRLVDGDTGLLPGLRLIATTGHVPGHQSVLVELPETGPVLLAIDAVAAERFFRPDRPAVPRRDLDYDALVASTRKLIDLVASENVSLVVFHHDGDQWAKLKTAPDSYA